VLRLDGASLVPRDGPPGPGRPGGPDGPGTADGSPRRTAAGVLVPVAGGALLATGRPEPGWETPARELGRQVSMLLRAHEALLAKRRHEAELAALYETAGQLTSHLDVEHVLTTIAEKARSLLGADLAYITLLDREAGVVRMRVSAGHRTPGFLEIVLPLGAGVGGMVAGSARPAYSADYLNDERLSHHAATDEAVRREGIRSILGVPLRGRGGVLGVLYVANRSVHVFGADEVRLLKSLGDHAALALDNARLYEEAVRAARASAASEAVAAARLEELERAEEVHHGLTDVALAGEGVEGVARGLAAALELGVVVTDWRHAVLVQVGCPELVDPQGWLSAAFRRRLEVRRALADCGRTYATAAAGEGRLVAPIVARREILGYVWARRLGADQPSPSLLATGLEQAARVVALEMLRERAAAETELRLRRDFVHSLLADPPVERAVLLRQARQIWPHFERPHRPVILRMTGEDARPDHARQLVAEARPDDFASVYGSHVVVMLGETDQAAAAEAVERLHAALARNGLGVAAVVGGLCRELDQDRETLRGALRLQELLGPRPTLWLEGREVLTVLFDPDSRPRLRRFLDQTLAPLAGQPALIATLGAYYEAAGNRALAARRLGIHVNTLRYRLERVEALLGSSIDEPSRAVPLRVALLAREAMA
jgi:hypothetical protein